MSDRARIVAELEELHRRARLSAGLSTSPHATGVADGIDQARRLVEVLPEAPPETPTERVEKARAKAQASTEHVHCGATSPCTEHGSTECILRPCRCFRWRPRAAGVSA